MIKASTNRYVNLLKNSGFHALFGDEDNKDVVIGVLNMLLPAHHQVTDFTYLRTELHGPLLTNREYRYDFVCRDTAGLTFIVEMQCYDEAYWFKRCVSYCCRSYDRLTVKGEKKEDEEQEAEEKTKKGAGKENVTDSIITLEPTGYDVPPLYFIGFMGIDLKHEDEQAWEGLFISEYTFMEKTTHELQDETIFIIFAELKRFNKSEEECVTSQDKLLYLFKHIGELEDDENWNKDKFWQRFFEACEIAAFSEKKRAQYEQDMYDERRFQGQLAASYNNGLEAGIEKGIAEGREEERLEAQKKLIASAKKMVESGVDVDLVCSTLGVDKAAVLEK